MSDREESEGSLKTHITRRLGIGGIVLAGLVGMGFACVYVGSEWQLRSTPDTPLFTREIPSDAESIERGRHIARTRGCFGCHGQQLEGAVFTEEWTWVDRAVAPNLALHAKEYPPAVLERAIRRGVGHDGRALWSMPSYNWVHLSDDDVAALIAFLRSEPAAESDLPRGRMGWSARRSIATGAEGHMADWAADVPPLLLASDDDPVLVRGEYLAMTACNECHGLDLRGSNSGPDIAPPDLAVVAAYSWGEFNRLMDSGLPRDGRESLGLMTVVARDRFAYFYEEEREALYAFLQTLISRPVPRDVSWRAPIETS